MTLTGRFKTNQISLVSHSFAADVCISFVLLSDYADVITDRVSYHPQSQKIHTSINVFSRGWLFCYNEIWIYNVGQENKPCKQCMHFHISCHSWSVSQTLWTWPIPTKYNYCGYKHTINLAYIDVSLVFPSLPYVSFLHNCLLLSN